MAGERRYDVFLCYRWGEDKVLVDQLHDALTALGVAVFKDDAQVDDWAEMLPAIRQALLGSRLLVPVLTPRFQESEHCRTELHLALLHGYWLDQGRSTRVLPVLWQLEARDVRPRVLKHHKLPKAGKSPDELARQIKAAVDTLRDSDPRRFGDAPEIPRPQWFPAPLVKRSRFTGRADELWDLHEALLANDSPKDRGHPVVSVRGVGGQGKSALVTQYALWFAEDHPGGVFVLELAGSDGRPLNLDGVRRRFERALERIADSLDLDPEQLTTLGVRRAVTRALRRRGPYLWLVDGVPSQVDTELVPELYAPTANGKTVFTTRGRLRELVSAELELEPLRPRDAFTLLTVEREPVDRAEVQAARGIVRTLDGHPLGLRLAAGQTLSPGFAGYAALLDDVRGTGEDVLELTANLTGVLPTGYVTAFSATLLRSYRRLTEAGREVLDAASVLGAEGIPWSLLLDLVVAMTGAERAGATLDDGLAHLAAFGLADETDSDVVVHALVSRAVRTLSARERRQRWRASAVRVLTALMVAPRASRDEDQRIARCLPHVNAAVGPLDVRNEWPVGLDEWHLVSEAARVEYEIGDSRRSLAHLRSLDVACRKSSECDADTRLRIRVNLASAHANFGDHDTARQLLDGVLDAARDPGVAAMTTEVLGNCYAALGDHSRAVALLKRAYRVRQKAQDDRTLITLNNVVISVGAGSEPGDWRLALRLAFGAYARWHRSAGPDCLGTLDSLTSIGANLLRLKEFAAACAVFEHVWQRRRAVQGERHPDTIGAGENLVHSRDLQAKGLS